MAVERATAAPERTCEIHLEMADGGGPVHGQVFEVSDGARWGSARDLQLDHVLGTASPAGVLFLEAAPRDRWIYAKSSHHEGLTRLPAGGRRATVRLVEMKTVTVRAKDAQLRPVAGVDVRFSPVIFAPEHPPERVFGEPQNARPTDESGEVTVHWPRPWGPPEEAEVHASIPGRAVRTMLVGADLGVPTELQIGEVGYLAIEVLGGSGRVDRRFRFELDGTPSREIEVWMTRSPSMGAIDVSWHAPTAPAAPVAAHGPRASEDDTILVPVPLSQRFKVRRNVGDSRDVSEEVDGPVREGERVAVTIDTRMTTLCGRLLGRVAESMNAIVVRDSRIESTWFRAWEDGTFRVDFTRDEAAALVVLCGRTTCREFPSLALDAEEIDLGEIEMQVRPSLGYIVPRNEAGELVFGRIAFERLRGVDGHRIFPGKGMAHADFGGLVRIRKVRDFGWEILGTPSLSKVTVKLLPVGPMQKSIRVELSEGRLVELDLSR